jgi:hypothetical protein
MQIVKGHFSSEKRPGRLCHPGPATPAEVPAQAWNELLAQQDAPTPFMRHEYLSALHDSGSAVPDTGWQPSFVTLWRGGDAGGLPAVPQGPLVRRVRVRLGLGQCLRAARPAYYPKAVVAVPFTPVPGSACWRATTNPARVLAEGLLQACASSRSCRRCTCCSCPTPTCGLRSRRPHGAPHGAVPLDEPGLAHVRRLPGQPGAGQAQEDPAGAAQGAGRRRHLPRAARRPDPRGRLGLLLPLLRAHLPRARQPALPQAGFLPRHGAHMPENWLLFIAQRGARTSPAA